MSGVDRSSILRSVAKKIFMKIKRKIRASSAPDIYTHYPNSGGKLFYGCSGNSWPACANSTPAIFIVWQSLDTLKIRCLKKKIHDI